MKLSPPPLREVHSRVFLVGNIGEFSSFDAPATAHYSAKFTVSEEQLDGTYRLLDFAGMRRFVRKWIAVLMVAATAVAGGLNGYLAQDHIVGGPVHVEVLADHDQNASGNPGHLHIVIAQHDHEDDHDLPCGDGTCDGPVHHHCVTVHVHCGGYPGLTPGGIGLSPLNAELARFTESEYALPSGQIASPLYRPPCLLV